MVKYCSKCGEKISEDSEFCGNCGTPQRKKQNSTNIIIIAALVIIVALLAVGVLLVGNKSSSEITLDYADPLNPMDGVNFKLTSNNQPIANQPVEIIIKNDADTYTYSGTTDSDGNALIDLNGIDDGTYTIEGKYGGNNKYGDSSVVDMVEIKNSVQSVNADPVSSEPDYESYSYAHSFESTDTNGDGYVTLSDMNIAHTPVNIRDQMYADSDDNNDGLLNSHEYYKFMYKLNYDKGSYGL